MANIEKTTSNVPAVQSQSEVMEWLQKHTTPLDMIEKRQGRGGNEFYYLRHQYVTQKLNELFGFNWDFEVVDKTVIENDISVLGKLTLRIGDHTLVKSQYGGAKIERYSSDNKNADQIISLGDSFKTAASDALKKCASLLGLGLDLALPPREESLKRLDEVGSSKKWDWSKKKSQAIRIMTGGNKTSVDEMTDVEVRVLTAFLEGNTDSDIVKEVAQYF